MNKEDFLIYATTDDTIDEQIYECEMKLDIMEERLCEQLGEEFEDYKSVIERYIDLIRFKCQIDGVAAASRIFLDDKQN